MANGKNGQHERAESDVQTKISRRNLLGKIGLGAVGLVAVSTPLLATKDRA